MQDYRDVLTDILLNAGLHGIAQSKITSKLQRLVGAASVKQELERLRKLQKVQSFTIPNKGTRPTKVWRATTLLLED